MTVRMFIAAVCLCIAGTLPAAADIPGAYGVWESSGSTKSKPVTAFKFTAPKASKKAQKIANKKIKLASLEPTAPLGKPKALLSGGGKPSVSASAPSKVAYKGGYSAGTVVVDQSQKKLYYVLGGGKAYAYPVAVGKKGFKWTGTQKVSKVVSWPDWTPPDEMRQRKPHLPLKMTGGINNPLGAKAIYLGSSLYRIHGTNAPGSIGTEASSGCIRMHNGHVVHLAGMVSGGTKVHVVN
jgi:lipoprotein-anchoring transpeptidase ErfK/SrfK